MPSLIFSPTALKDLARLHEFLRSKSLTAARLATVKIMENLKNLEQHPDIGRTVEERPPEYRELVIPFGRDGYIAAYRCSSEAIIILGIWHQREQRDNV